MGICGMNTNPKKVNIQSTRTQSQSQSLALNPSSTSHQKAEENFKDFEEYNSNNKKIYNQYIYKYNIKKRW
jgi:hypothetical protein